MATRPKYGGRKKGTPNKMTVAAREAFQNAFDGLGGVTALTKWARENTTEFYKLYGRLIPTEVTGKDGGAIGVSIEGLSEILKGIDGADTGPGPARSRRN